MEKEIYLKSKRGSLIHAYAQTADGKGGLVVFAHSFKGEADEDDRYRRLAQMLAEIGVYSIRMEFPGSPFAFEDDRAYCLSNCLDDMEVCAEHMRTNYEIAEDHLGLVGYSMGGRLACLFAMKHPEYKTLVLWAPCNIVYGLEDNFLEQNVGMMKKEADEKGSINFYDIFHKQTTVFPAEFVYDLLDQRIKGFKDFPGNILIVHGDNDITVDVKESISLYNDLDKCSEKKLEILEKADHGFGLWDGRISDNEKLIEHSFSFLKEYL